ncbi:hypothetical protein [Streptomyces sp. NPDC052192]|uniref:hypothetical protein n=1 Tax=Streptomyces sp. NPDC052192 TaxID=3155052 RepID=UPI0034179B5C
MTRTKRVLAAVLLTGAALSFSGIAQAQENGSALPSSNEAPAANADIPDAHDGFVSVFNKQTRELLSKVVKGNLAEDTRNTLG